MSYEVLDILGDSRKRAIEQAERVQISQELLEIPFNVDYELMRQTAVFLEIAVLDLASHGFEEDDEKSTRIETRRCGCFPFTSSFAQTG